MELGYPWPTRDTTSHVTFFVKILSGRRFSAKKRSCSACLCLSREIVMHRTHASNNVFTRIIVNAADFFLKTMELHFAKFVMAVSH